MNTGSASSTVRQATVAQKYQPHQTPHESAPEAVRVQAQRVTVAIPSTSRDFHFTGSKRVAQRPFTHACDVRTFSPDGTPLTIGPRGRTAASCNTRKSRSGHTAARPVLRPRGVRTSSLPPPPLELASPEIDVRPACVAQVPGPQRRELGAG